MGMEATAGLFGTILQPFAGAIGAREANRSNETISKDVTAFNKKEAARNRSWQEIQNQKQMDFQKLMSNTQHQRQMKDLAAAGLNPLMALQSGAGTPMGTTSAGSAAQGVGATIQNEMAGFSASARDAASLALQFQKQQSEIKSLEAGIENTQANTVKTLTDEKVSRKGIPQADFNNKMYKAVSPLLNKVTEGINSGAKYLDKVGGRIHDYFNPSPLQTKPKSIKRGIMP